MKIIDFTDIDLYPSRYWVNHKNGQMMFNIRSLNIEKVQDQVERLGAKKTTLMTGDAILVDTYFGHNTAKASEPECWIDVSLTGQFEVVDIIPHPDSGEIEMKVKALSD